MRPTLYILLLAGIMSGCDLRKSEPAEATHETVYTCPMHPEIIRDEPGSCPICGMELVLKESGGDQVNEVDVHTQLEPVNRSVLSTLRMTTLQPGQEAIEVEALGTTAYNTDAVSTIPARISGRIERLYVRYRFQKVEKGQRIMDIYSPELLTAQQNLLFLLESDPENTALINAVKDRLMLEGVSATQIRELISTRRPVSTFTVYSTAGGHVHEAEGQGAMPSSARRSPMGEGGSSTPGLSTAELSLKEGMYVQKGQAVFFVYDPNQLWILLNLYPGQQTLVKKGDPVRIVPESAPLKNFRATLDFIEPFYRPGSRTLIARVNFDNRELELPVGSQVRALIFGKTQEAQWLPETAVLFLGMNHVVFVRSDSGFAARQVQTGLQVNNKVQILGGLGAGEEVAANAQYLVDSESFIKVK